MSKTKTEETIYDKGPVRRGATYCSPWCGGRCTHAAYKEATRLAAQLAKKLGPLWEPRVWENLGWHWSVRTKDGRLKVHASNFDKSFTAYLSPNDSGSGKFAYGGKTVREAIELCAERAHQELEEAVAMVGVATEALRGMKS